MAWRVGSGMQSAGSVRLLKYRFDSIDQVSRHFHVANGRVVLFYPTLVALRPGDAVLLDVTFVNSEQHCALRGIVIGKDAATTHAGWWLEFAAHGLVASLHSAATTAKRRQRRFPSDMIVNVARQDGLPVVARLVDVGLGGGRISGASLSVRPGEKVRVSFFSRDTGAPVIAARVAWVRTPEVGLEFVKPTPGERAAITAVIDEARHALADADEATHPAFCRCVEGHALPEPPMPRSAHRLTGSR